MNNYNALPPGTTRRQFSPLQLRAAAELERRRRTSTAVDPWLTIARPNQLPPPGPSWLAWLILAGRGFGKTRCITEWARMQAETMPGSRGAMVAATAADVRDVLIEGESGMMNISPPHFRPNYQPSIRRLTWPNGSTATLFSAEEPDRLRGPQHHWAVCDELAAWARPETFDQLMFGLRLGEHPRVAIATTPRPIKIIRQIMADPTTHLTRGSTYENRDNLAPAFFEQIVSKYSGTRLGRQELMAEMLEDNYGSLWHRGIIQYKGID